MDKGQISRHTTVVLFANIASLVFGLLATVVVARYFGSGRTVDAFFVALSVPQVIGQIALSVALVSIVPIYTAIRSDRGEAQAQRAFAGVFWAGTILFSALAVAVVVAAPLAIRILAPGFDTETVGRAVRLLSWLAPLIVLFGLSGILQAVANANQSFKRPAWAKPLPTATALGLLLAFTTRQGLEAYAWGMVIGALLGLAWQFHEVWKLGDFQPRLRGLGTTVSQLKSAGGAILTARLLGQSGVLVTGMVASTVAVGAISALAYAFKVVSIPLLGASAFAVVIFPALAQATARADGTRELQLIWRGVRVMALLGFVSAVPLFLWAGPLIQFLFERGEFSPAATATATGALRIYALGIAFVAANTTIGNAFWARRWFAARLWLEAGAIIVLVSLAFSLGRIWGVVGIATASVAEFAALTAAGLYYIQRRTPADHLRRHFIILGKMLLIALAVLLLAWPLVPDVQDFRAWSFLERISILAGGMGLCGILFLMFGFLWWLPEIDDVITLLFARFTRSGRALDPHQQRLLPNRIRTRLGRLFWRLVPRPTPVATRPEMLGRILAGTVNPETVATDFQGSPRPPGLYDGDGCTLSLHELAIARDAALRREVDLLGSGPVELGRPIQWHKDYVSGYVWPARHHARVRIVAAGSGTDCKFPWELSRCQHWAWLACEASDGPSGDQEMLAQFREFVAANPPGVGINYTNAMEVAIRSVNWLTAFRTAAHRLSPEAIVHLAVEMQAAGRHIRSHLEFTDRGLNSNHYIADLLGLYAISTMFPSLPHASEWYRFSGDELTAELSHQFDPEGVHREGSPAYARLVLEFYLYAYLLGKRATDPRVDTWQERLTKGLDYLATISYPDGRLPQFGDDDAGRLLVPPGEPVDDYRYLLQIGAVLFDRTDWKERAGAAPRPGLEFWLGQEGLKRYAQLARLPAHPVQRTFTPAGLTVCRTAECILTVQGGRTEALGPRGHLHNDLTGFEFCADETRWILDPGTYQYTRHPLWRNRFRSTAAHNVVQVDDEEQNGWNPDWLFYLSHDASPLPVRFQDGVIRVGYERPSGSAAKRVSRQIDCSPDGRAFRVTDHIEGSGHHTLTLGLNLARRPFTYLSRHLLLFRGLKGDLLLHVPLPQGFLTSLQDGWQAPRFGVRDRCFRFEASGNTSLPAELNWGFAAVPKGEDILAWSVRIGAEESVLPAEQRS